MNVFINDTKFTEEPGSCEACPFFFNGRSELTPRASAKGWCKLFDEMHNSWRETPRRCRKLFKKAATYPDGTHLAIVATTKEK